MGLQIADRRWPSASCCCVLAAARALQHAAGLSVLQAPDSRSRLVVSAVRGRSCCVARVERREPDRRPRRPGDQHRSRSPRRRTPRWPTSSATACSPTTCCSCTFRRSAELTIFCGSLVGASLGFLWYNSYPAEIFMGDVGSLALGAALGTVAILIKQELLLRRSSAACSCSRRCRSSSRSRRSS